MSFWKSLFGPKSVAKRTPRTLLPQNEAVAALHECVQKRPRPEDVAELAVDVLDGQLTPREAVILQKAAKNSLKQGAYAYSSMAADFLRPVGAQRQVQKAEELFSVGTSLSSTDCLQPEKVDALLREISASIRYRIGEDNFKTDRLNRAAREELSIALRKRQYNKRWRFLKRLEAKILRMTLAYRKYAFTRYSKSALAIHLSEKDLAKDTATACFVAYLSARMSLRSVFTNTSQERSFDEIAAMLYEKARQSPTVNWWAIAHVHPEVEVLTHLTDEQKGELLGAWFAILRDLGDLLRDLWSENEIERETLIVRRGNDSSTWNQTAGAWNKAREHWIALLHSLGMSQMLNDLCPGKVLRLMAADVAAWHRACGGELHPDTKVWAELPLPWEVLEGRANCGKATVESACRKHKVNPSGWIGPKPPKTAAPFRPTPELVHGVAISSPALASALRSAGWFSAKSAVPIAASVVVERDINGFATGASATAPSEPTEVHRTKN